MNGNIVIQFNDVTREYGRKVTALKGMNLAIREGTSYGLLGRNGAGKSTALRLAMGMLHPTSGVVRVFGKDPFDDPKTVKADIGYMAEDQELPSMLNPADLFRLYADLYPGWDRAFEEELVGRLELPTTRRLSSLSKGQKRQVALICAVVHRPKLLILDEPGGGLDPVVRRDFLDAVVEMLNRGGTTVLFSSHILQEVERIASRVGILHKGELILEEDLDRLREGSCRVLVESDHAISPTSVPKCVRAVDRDGVCSLTMRCGEEEARQRIREHLGREVRQVQVLSLEDFFVDLVGAKQ